MCSLCYVLAVADSGLYLFWSESCLEIPLVSFAFFYSYFHLRLNTLEANPGRLVTTSYDTLLTSYDDERHLARERYLRLFIPSRAYDPQK